MDYQSRPRFWFFSFAAHLQQGGGLPMLQKQNGTGTPRSVLFPAFLCLAVFVLCAAGPPQASPGGRPVEVVSQKQPSAPAPEPTKRPRTAEQVVGGKCLQCHRAVVEAFVNEVHGKAAHFGTRG